MINRIAILKTQAKSKILSPNMGYTAHFVRPKNCFAIPSHTPNIKLNLPSFLVGVEEQDV